jgi:hypothetical protein
MADVWYKTSNDGIVYYPISPKAVQFFGFFSGSPSTGYPFVDKEPDYGWLKANNLTLLPSPEEDLI